MGGRGLADRWVGLGWAGPRWGGLTDRWVGLGQLGGGGWGDNWPHPHRQTPDHQFNHTLLHVRVIHNCNNCCNFIRKNFPSYKDICYIIVAMCVS